MGAGESSSDSHVFQLMSQLIMLRCVALLEKHGISVLPQSLKIMLRWATFKVPARNPSTSLEVQDEVRDILCDHTTRRDEAAAQMLPAWKAILKAIKVQEKTNKEKAASEGSSPSEPPAKDRKFAGAVGGEPEDGPSFPDPFDPGGEPDSIAEELAPPRAMRHELEPCRSECLEPGGPLRLVCSLSVCPLPECSGGGRSGAGMAP